MKKIMNIFFTLVFSLFSITSFASKFITIGTGGVTGTYYPTGGAICRLVNKERKVTKIRCSVESTGGSVYNINTIKNKELDFGLAQSDVIYQATKGIDQFKGKPIKKLRSVMAIYPELLTLVARKDSKIKKIADLKNKRVNLGNPGSGTRNTSELLLKESGIKKSSLKFIGTLKPAEMPDALKDNKIDAYFYVVGHPTANVKDASNSVAVNIVPLTGVAVDNIVKEYPYFAKANIAGGLYKGNDKDIPTFGVKAVLVTSTDVKNDVVYNVTKAILENFDEFKKLHPAYANITKKSLLDGLSAELHPGAKKYMKEVGLLK